MPLKTQQEQPPELNLTPMIDIVFLLIIFFMVGTKFAETERTVKLEVPRVKGMGVSNPIAAKRIVNVYRDGSVLLDREEVTIDDLKQRLQVASKHNSELGVIVRGDAEGTFQNVARVLTVCREAGVRDLGISVQQDRSLR